jgi:hypothetical protein
MFDKIKLTRSRSEVRSHCRRTSARMYHFVAKHDSNGCPLVSLGKPINLNDSMDRGVPTLHRSLENDFSAIEHSAHCTLEKRRLRLEHQPIR